MLLKQTLQNAWSFSQRINCEEGNKIRVHKRHSSVLTASSATEEAVYGGVKKERQSEKGAR
jgi:hypothetical protein